MPVYEYEHAGEGCSRGKRFEIEQPISAEPLKVCPDCDDPVQRLMSRIHVSTPTTNSEYKNMGFAKLVKRDTGVYENVTAMDGESKVMEAGKPETMPNIKRRISD